MVRPPCCDKLNLKRALWTAEEDAKILAHVSKHGTGNWTTVPRKAGLKRCGKSCRLRWTNYLRPDLKHDSFTPEEEEWIIRLHAAIGSRWSIIAQQLPGRTDNDVKNYWNTKLRKKLTEMGIDPITHKPFSQILADYGNIGGFPKATETQIGSLNGNLKNAFKLRAEQPSVPPQVLEDFKSHQTKAAETPHESEPGANDHSMELLSELQAITVVKEVSNCTKQRPGFKGTSAPSPRPSSSSSSSTCSTAAQAMSPMAFSWQDFLLEDAFPPQEQGQAPTSMAEQNNDLNCIIWGEQKGFNGAAKQDCRVHESGFQASTSNSTFVDAILDRESELFVEFPDIFEEPFYC